MNFEINYNKRDELSDIISDSFKDLHGFRPRHIDFKNTPIQDLEEIAERLSVELHNEIIFQNQEKERLIQIVMEYGAPDAETAERWLESADYPEEFYL